MPKPIDTAREIAELASDALATNITVLDIGKLSVIADVFVVCSADNPRQLRAVQDDVTEGLQKQGLRPLRIEGTPDTGWVLMDYGDVVVHLFTEDQREFYRLEDVWSEAPKLLVIQ